MLIAGAHRSLRARRARSTSPMRGAGRLPRGVSTRAPRCVAPGPSRRHRSAHVAEERCRAWRQRATLAAGTGLEPVPGRSKRPGLPLADPAARARAHPPAMQWCEQVRDLPHVRILPYPAALGAPGQTRSRWETSVATNIACRPDPHAVGVDDRRTSRQAAVRLRPPHGGRRSLIRGSAKPGATERRPGGATRCGPRRTTVTRGHTWGAVPTAASSAD